MFQKLIKKVVLIVCVVLLGFLGIQCDSAMPSEPQAELQSEVQILRQDLNEYTKLFVETSPVESRGWKSIISGLRKFFRAISIGCGDAATFLGTFSTEKASETSDKIGSSIDNSMNMSNKFNPDGYKSIFDFSRIEEESTLITGENIRQGGEGEIDLGLREGALHNRIIVAARQIDPNGGTQAILSAIKQTTGKIYSIEELAEWSLPDSIALDVDEIFDYYQKKDGANKELYHLVRGYFEDCKMFEEEFDFVTFTAGYLDVIAASDIEESLKEETIRGIEFAFSSIMFWYYVQVDEEPEE